MPGPVASGQLGGPVYDVVYRLTVQPGYVIVAGLTGTAGTDFDLYLFDSTATTVVSTQGLLAKSTGPTSTEQLSYPSFAGGTYYLDLNGASNVEGTYRLTVQFVRDSSTPSASLLLGNGRAATNSTSVPVALTGTSALSGIAVMAFSGDGVNFGPWQPYGVSSTWTFPVGDGVKTLWAKVRNGVGTESAVVSASIGSTRFRRRLTSITPTPNAVASGLRPTFTIRFSKPMDPATWDNDGLVVQAASGQQVIGTYSYDVRSWTGTFIPDADLQAGAPYVVNVGAVTDVAGNLVNSVGSWVVTPVPVPSLALTASSGLVLPGTAVTLSGHATDLDGQPVFLETRQGASTSVDRSPVVMADGAWTTTLVPAVNSWYRLVFDGSSVAAAAQSNEVRGHRAADRDARRRHVVGEPHRDVGDAGHADGAGGAAGRRGGAVLPAVPLRRGEAGVRPVPKLRPDDGREREGDPRLDDLGGTLVLEGGGAAVAGLREQHHARLPMDGDRRLTPLASVGGPDRSRRLTVARRAPGCDRP